MKKRNVFVLTMIVLFAVAPWTCEPTFAGQIVAWGRNDYGECNVSAGDDFVAITGGLVHGIALRFDGSLVAWGDNNYGQCDVPEGNDFTAISSSQSHSLGLKSDGSLVAWGRNSHGQCDVPTGNYFVAIATGYYHSIAIKSDGSLVAWGYNYSGQCDVPTGNDFVAIAGGFGQSLAIKSDGSLVAWGSDRFNLNIVPAGNNFIAVASGFSHNLALRSDGSLVAWGYNYSGQCNVPTGNDFVAIAANSDYCIALRTDGSLIAWGYNSSGQCDVPSGNSFTAIAAGYAYASALTSAPARLVGIEIVGPEQVGESFHAQYKAVAQYEDGSTRNATDSAIWQAEPAAIANIDEHGMLYTHGVDISEEVTVYAQYTEGGIDVEAQVGVEVYPSTTIYVPEDYNNIQAAINAARDVDIVVVADGVYFGNGNYDISFSGKAILVHSENGPENCIIDCQNLGRGFTFDYGEKEDSILYGFTITNGRASNGAGIYCSYSSPLISNCIISRNAVVEGNGDTTGWGGGLYCYYGNPTIINCIFSENSTEYAGGGINCWGGDPTIINCIIIQNTAYRGAGIYCLSGNPTITNCIITGNRAEYAGGGIHCWYSSNTTIINCTFIENSSPNGNVLAFDSWGQQYPSNLQLTNCILWNGGNEIFNVDDSTIIITYSDIQGGWEGEGNIDEDPCFAFSNDFHLMPDSPCIDAGTNDPCGTSLPDTDADGNPRPLDGDSNGIATADMGAYEFTPDSPSVAVSAPLLNFSCVQNWLTPDSQTLLIINCGGQTLNWQIVEDCNWLQVTPMTGTSTGNINEVNLIVDSNGLEPGDYGCILTVLDPNAANSPLTVSVTLSVGAILRVPQQYDTIQAAIDVADDLDMVLVADGVYTGDGNRDIDFLGKPITVKSENGPVNCIIDCEGTQAEPHRGFFFDGQEDANSVLDGFTITNGYAERGGSGIYCHGSIPTITKCTITRNANVGIEYLRVCGDVTITDCTITENGGSGIVCRAIGNVTIADCNITGNSSRGIYCEVIGNVTITDCNIAENSDGGIYSDNSNSTITNCIIATNSASEHGGGIFCGYGSPVISNCIITNNSAAHGGAITCYDSSPVISNCIITNNSARSGGAIRCYGNSNPVIKNCIITGNLSGSSYFGDYCCGGGIYCEGGNPTITNCIIAGNRAEYAGGGVYCFQSSSATITNCTFIENSSPNGNVLACDSWGQRYPSNLQINNSILRSGGDEIWNNDNSIITINYSNIQGGWEGQGNIDADPCFVTPSYWDLNGTPADANDDFWLDGDYHLLPFSPCIDAGTDANVYNDIEGNVRPFDFPGVDNNGQLPEFDMGAYEATTVEAHLRVIPRVINRNSRRPRIMAIIRLPEGITKDQIDTDQPIMLYPGGVESIYQRAIQYNRRRTSRTIIFALFSKDELMSAVPDNGRVELEVVGNLKTGQYFYGTNTVWIRSRRWPPHRRHR